MNLRGVVDEHIGLLKLEGAADVVFLGSLNVADFELFTAAVFAIAP